MKFVIASDIHGSFTAAEKIVAAAEREQADVLVLLGDLYYHGPRNPIPEGYDPMKVAALLSGYAGKKVALCGNCDADIDRTISSFPLADHFAAAAGNKTVFFTHGHVFSPENPPTGYDILICGHFHTAKIERRGEMIFANPGSISLPKNDVRGYLVLTDHALTLKTVEGEKADEAVW